MRFEPISIAFTFTYLLFLLCICNCVGWVGSQFGFATDNMTFTVISFFTLLVTQLGIIRGFNSALAEAV